MNNKIADKLRANSNPIFMIVFDVLLVIIDFRVKITKYKLLLNFNVLNCRFTMTECSFYYQSVILILLIDFNWNKKTEQKLFSFNGRDDRI